MCMMCEEEAMYQAYLDYLARKAAEQEGGKQKPTGMSQAGGFVCDPAPDDASEARAVDRAEGRVLMCEECGDEVETLREVYLARRCPHGADLDAAAAVGRGRSGRRPQRRQPRRRLSAPLSRPSSACPNSPPSRSRRRARRCARRSCRPSSSPRRISPRSRRRARSTPLCWRRRRRRATWRRRPTRASPKARRGRSKAFRSASRTCSHPRRAHHRLLAISSTISCRPTSRPSPRSSGATAR